MSDVSINVNEHIAVVTLNRPPINSLVKQTYRDLEAAFRQVSNIDGVRVAVLRCEGRFFCPGNDVTEFQNVASAHDATEYAQAVSDGISSIYECEVPVVAAVHADAFGAGMAMAACADIVIAAEEAKFGIPEIKVGVIGAYAFLELLVPEKVARQLSLTGGSITADEVAQYGGVHKVVPSKDVLDTAMAVAGELCQRGPTALRYFKAAINTNHNAQLVEKYAIESSYTAKYVGTAESLESVNAFVERRTPKYDS